MVGIRLLARIIARLHPHLACTASNTLVSVLPAKQQITVKKRRILCNMKCYFFRVTVYQMEWSDMHANRLRSKYYNRCVKRLRDAGH